MGLEIANDYNDLDQTNPAQGDGLVEGDDHIRLLKKVMKQVWPGVGGNGLVGTITTTEAQLNFSNSLTANIQDQLNAINTILDSGAGLLPIGAIITYNGAFVDIPANFQLCDGTNGTPDMANQFVYGTNTELEINAAGGSADAVVVAHTHTADHNHTGTTSTDGNHVHDLITDTGAAGGGLNGTSNNATDATTPVSGLTVSAGDHAHALNVDIENVLTSSTGGTGVGDNVPNFIKLAFIRRMT